MSIQKRRELLAAIGERRGSFVVSYFLGNRPGAQTRMFGDALTYLYKHLRQVTADRKTNLDLFLFSDGGDIEVPWRITSMFREIGRQFGVLIPYRAMSAATLVTISADEIVMTPKAELGPIDPSITIQKTTGQQEEISVEDVVAYFEFLDKRAGIRDQSALSAATNIMAEKLTPLLLGKVHRVHSHIREVARKMLESRTKRLDDRITEAIIATLAEETRSHGHAIGRNEGRTIGLPIIKDDPELEALLWNLYLEYEQDFELLDPINPHEDMFQNEDRITVD
ncbi:MAG: hypothetical protein ACE5OQ_11920, partial [Woeseia sp.]